MKSVYFLSLAAVAALAVEPVTLQKISVEGDAVDADLSTNTLARSKSTSMTGDAASLLADIPGVSVYQTGGSASLPVIHGLADDRIKIDIDGMTITSACPNHMNPALSYIDSSKIQSVEVTAGITPVSAGGDSIAGTISVKSKDPQFAKKAGEALVEGEISGFYRSNAQARGGAINATVANDKISFSYSGFAEKAGNYKDGNSNIVKDTLYQQQNNSATLAYKLDNGYIALKAAHTNADYIGFPNQYMDMLGNESTLLNLMYKGKLGNLWIDANVYHQNVDHYMNKILSERTGNMPMYTEGKESGANLKATLPYSSTQTFKFGAEYDRYRLNDWWPADTVRNMAGMNPNTFWNINNGQRDRLGVFAESHSQWSEKLSSIIGIRYDRVMMDTGDVVGYNDGTGMYAMAANDPIDASYFNALDHKKTDNNIDFTATTRYEYNAMSDLELGFARKTRSPNIYERYAWAGSSGLTYSNPVLMDMRMVNWFGDANGYVGNLNLDPEIAYTLSATVSLHDESSRVWGAKLTPYYTKVKDYIDVNLVNTAADGRRYFQFVNADAHLFGADLSGYTTLWNNADNGRGVLKGSLSYTRGFRDNGGSLYHMMPLHAKITLERFSGAWTNGVEVEGVAKKDSVDTLRREPMTPGYALVNLRTGYAWSKQLNMDFSVTNFFNKAYALPLGGIDVVNYAAASYLPLQGMGRSFNAALSYKF